MRDLQMEMFGGPLKRKRRNPPPPYWMNYIPIEERNKIELENKLKKSLVDCDFPPRVINELERAGIFNVEELISKSEEELKLLCRIGNMTFEHCAMLLKKMEINWERRNG